MKYFVSLLLGCLMSLATQSVSAANIKALQIKEKGATTYYIPYTDIDCVYFRNDSIIVATSYQTLQLAVDDLQAISYGSLSNALQVAVSYDDSNPDGEVSIVNCLAHRGVKVETEGGHVTVTSDMTDQELTLTLSGHHANGSLTYEGSYKMTLELNGLDLTSQKGAAIDIACGKRIAVKLVADTENRLADYADGKQKAALYFKGHPEFEGAGKLYVTGNCKHAISTKEYMQLKKSVGTISILGSANDGIHAGQYFQINGGTVEIRNVAGDGIQVESTNNLEDENNGQMIVKGGSLTIDCTATDVACLKADSLITISGGTLNLAASGIASRGIKGKADINITDGHINVTCTGKGVLGDPSGETSTTSYCVYVSVPNSTSSGGWPGPGGTQFGGAWRTIYIYKEDGTQLGTLNSSVSVSVSGQRKTFYYYDFKQATEGTFYFGAPNYNNYQIKSGTFSGPTDGKNHFYTISSTYSTSGTVRTYSISDVTTTYQNAVISADGTESTSAACIKTDGHLSITGGAITLSATGKGGKGINIDGDLTLGETDGNGPTLSVSTSGKVVSSSGSGMNTKLVGQPKAIKALGNIVINSGNISASTKNEGGEGIESKSAITINGGTIACDAYDDGINAAQKITFNGGITWSHSSGNDGIDCNGSNGFEMNGGIILASGTRSPEEGFDCDNYKFAINGGTMIGTGGATSSPTSASQPFKSLTSQSLTVNTYLSLQQEDGTVICSYRVPETLSATVLVSSPEFKSGTSYKLVRNSTAVSNPTETYLDGMFTVGGTLTGGTSTSFTPTTK